MSAPSELLFGVLATQLGYCTADDVLSASRELVGRGDETLAGVLERRGVLSKPARELVTRLAARAAADRGDAARALDLLPRGPLRQGPRTTPDPIARQGDASAVEEQAGRYAVVTGADGAPVVLGEGGSGQVLLWQDGVLGREVAVKLADGNEARLFDEARLTGQLDHPAVVPVFELGRRASGEAYCTMQRVSGRTLTQAIADAKDLDGRLSLLPSFLVACRCIAAAHERGVVHRDLSSDRMMLGRFGEVYVLDWGLARRDELRSGERRVDLKCLGDVLSALLSGEGAQPLKGAPGDLLAISRRTRLPPQEGGLESVAALVRELQDFVDGRRVASYRYTAVELVRRFVTRHRAVTVGLVAVVAFLAVVAALAQAQVRRERDQARQFAQAFLDDVASTLTAIPGEQALVKSVTSTAVAHYERTTELERAPADERERVARAMLRLADLSLKLGRADDAASALAVARRLAEGLAKEREAAGPLLLLADCDGVEARLGSLADRAPGREQALVERGLALAERALQLEPRNVAGQVLASDLARHLGGLVPSEHAGAALQRAVDFGAAALAAAPDDVPAQLSQARNLALMAYAPDVAVDPARRKAFVDQALALLRAAQARAPDASEVRVALADVLVQEGTLREVDGDADGARAALTEARETALALLQHQPDSVDVMPSLVEAEVNLGLVKDAWQHLRTMEHNGTLADLEVVAPAVAFLVGEDGDAIRLAQLPGIESSGAALVYRALAAAMLGRPGDALIAARAARGKVQFVPWRKGLAYARIVSSGNLERPGRLAALRFAAAYDAAVPVTDVAPLDEALDRFISELEAQLPH